MNLNLREVDFEKDLDAYRTLRSLGESEPLTEEYLRDAELRFPPHSKRLRILAEIDGIPVGLAFWIAHQQYKAGMIWGQVVVSSEHRRCGIGKALWQCASERAKGFGFDRVWGECREDDQSSIGFAHRIGGERTAHIFESTLQINPNLMGRQPQKAIDPVNLVDFRSLADTEVTRRAIYDLFVLADADEPMTQVVGITPWEDFQKRFESPIFQRGLLCLAMDGDKFVGLAWVVRFSENYYNEFTGVHPDYRGRGIAKAMKGQCIDWLREEGVRTVRTHNDSRNAPMIAVNKQLGYQDEPGWFLFEAAL